MSTTPKGMGLGGYVTEWDGHGMEQDAVAWLAEKDVVAVTTDFCDVHCQVKLNTWLNGPNNLLNLIATHFFVNAEGDILCCLDRMTGIL